MPITDIMHMCRTHTQTPVLCNAQLVDVPMLITSHQLVAMVTKGHSGEMHVLALRGEPSSCVADLKEEPVEEADVSLTVVRTLFNTVIVT